MLSNASRCEESGQSVVMCLPECQVKTAAMQMILIEALTVAGIIARARVSARTHWEEGEADNPGRNVVHLYALKQGVERLYAMLRPVGACVSG